MVGCKRSLEITIKVCARKGLKYIRSKSTDRTETTWEDQYHIKLDDDDIDNNNNNNNNNIFKYEGWNFNSGNYLFATDTK